MTKISDNCKLIMDRIEKLHIRDFPGVGERILMASDAYPGAWLEHICDTLVLAGLDDRFSDIALRQLRLFFGRQNDEGQLPAYILDMSSPYIEPYLKEDTSIVRYTQVQEVVSVIRLCNEVCGANKDLLREFYPKCVKWDEWIVKNRMKNGLIQAFCAYDTGHDNSARFEGATQDMAGLPIDQCPENDVVPITAIDMSAIFYGGRMALADMAKKLGYKNEAEEWTKKAKAVKEKLFEMCYDYEDDFFYDLDKSGKKMPYRTIAITAMFCERMLTKEEADKIYVKHFRNPEEFATPYPFPAVAVNDKGSRPEHKGNSWSFYSQGNTVLRSLQWMDYYGYSEDLEKVMKIWLEAWTNSDVMFAQELNPITGVSSGCSEWFTPTMLFYVSSAKRLGLAE